MVPFWWAELVKSEIHHMKSFTSIDVCCLSAKSCPTLCKPLDCSPPGSSVYGISQARILEWVTISFSRGSLQPRDWTRISCVSCIDRWVLYHWATRETRASSLVSINKADRLGGWIRNECPLVFTGVFAPRCPAFLWCLLDTSKMVIDQADDYSNF